MAATRLDAKILPLLLLFVSLIVGQTVRFPLLGQGGGLLLSDIAVVIVLFSALKHLRKGSALLLLITPFLLWSLWGLIIYSVQGSVAEVAIAGAYWLRLASSLLLLPALVVLFKDRARRSWAEKGLLVTIGLLVLIGLMQWWFVSDLTWLTRFGWDPHQGRLVSTWLDPNFFGGFLLITLPFVLLQYRQSRLWAYGWLLVLMMGALVLTKSRSSLVALLATSSLLSPLLGRTYARGAVLGAWLLWWVGLGIVVLGERALHLVSSDPTIALRLMSLRSAWDIIQQHPLMGVGYNRYQLFIAPAGLMNNFSIHSRAGADNSFLTLWATTGIIGLAFFLMPWLRLGRQYLVRWLRERDVTALAGLGSLTALVIHAQFLNSFLYAHLLITLIILMALWST